MNEEDNYKSYKAFGVLISLIGIILILFTDNFILRNINKKIEEICLNNNLYAKNIIVTSNIEYKKNNEIKKMVPQDKSIFKLNLQEIYNKIIRIPEIKTATIKRKLFNTIEIFIEVYEPIALLENTDLVLCKDGSTINNLEGKQYLQIYGINHKKNFIKFYKKIKKVKIEHILENIELIRFNSKNIEIQFKNNKIVILDYTFSKKTLLHTLTN